MRRIVPILLATLFFGSGAFHLAAQSPINTPDNLGAGNCLDFDGSNDHVQVPESGSSSLDLTKFTIEGWVNLEATPSNLYVMLNKRPDAGDGLANYQLFINSSRQVALWIGNGVLSSYTATTTNGLTLNQWHHVAATYDQVNMNVYLDGVLEAQTAQTAVPQLSDADIFMGVYGQGETTDGPGSFRFNGKMDEIRIWDHALTQTEIKNSMCRTVDGSETGLSGYWKMNEGTGNTVGDLTINGHDGTRQ